MTDLFARMQPALSGRYELRRELGRGGMAVVFLADDVRHRRQVAIKVFQPELAGTVGHERFLREIQVAANLTHPHILPLYDSGEADGLLYYVMPYVQGETLRERLRRSGQLTLHEAVRIAGEVADALGYAHRQGLVHRDIKPENVMLASGHALVMDFGICRAVGEASSEEGLTRAGLTLGTPAYMSPEQWTMPDRVGEPSDIYSLGCVLYEMLVGEPPFTGTTAAVMLARHTQQEMPSVRVVRPDIPESVEAVVRRALAKLADARYASAYEFAEDLQSALTLPSLPIPAPSALTGQRSAAPVERPALFRRRSLLLAGVPLVLLGIGYGAFAGSRGIRASAGQPPRLMVLPFENLAAPDREYFADGLTEEITSRLATLTGLAVIARTTSMQYKATTKSTKVIGKEVRVGYILEGSVRCGCPPGAAPGPNDSLLITAKLINVADESTVWSNNYRRRLSDLFSLHSSISQEIGDALSLALLDPERERLAAKPTDNLAAYDFYLRGNSYYYRSWERKDVETAQAMYLQAVRLDPKYAAAWARVGHTHTWMHRLRYDQTESRLVQARQAIDRALALDDNLPEAHITLAIYYYWGRWDYDLAMDELLIARRLRPNDEEVTRFIGHIRRRQGKWPEAITAYEEAVKLDPQSHLAWFNLAESHTFVTNYEPAKQGLEQALVLAPEFFDGYLQLAHLALKSRGDAAEARRILDQAEERIPSDKWRPLFGFWIFGPARMIYSDLPDLLQRIKPGVYGLDSATYYLARAEIHDRRTESARALAHYDSARIHLERRLQQADRNAMQEIQDRPQGLVGRDPNESVVVGELALAYAALGRTREAVALGRQAAALMSTDKYEGVDWVLNLARVYMMVGNHTEAISQLELLLQMPSRVSAIWLRTDPVWRPLWDEPAFQRLVREQSQVTALHQGSHGGQLSGRRRS